MDGGDQPWWSKVVRPSGGVQGHHKAITLRFRPIAPKPANAGPEALLPPASSSLMGSKRGRKRKYVRVPKGSNNRRRRTRSNKKALPDLSKISEVVTLKLLPETSDPKQAPLKEPRQESGGKNNNNNNSGTYHQCNIIVPDDKELPGDLSSRIVCESELVSPSDVHSGGFWMPVRVVESWVTVEYVMNTHYPCLDLGQTSRVLSFNNKNIEKYDHLAQESERVRVLEADTCPGFLTDASNTVRWVNEAYKRLVAGDDHHRLADVQVSVRLVIKEELLPTIGSSPRFSCSVKLRYITVSEKGNPVRAMVVPCDVWRMDFHGGFAWRLDLVAALKLGFS